MIQQRTATRCASSCGTNIYTSATAMHTTTSTPSIFLPTSFATYTSSSSESRTTTPPTASKAPANAILRTSVEQSSAGVDTTNMTTNTLSARPRKIRRAEARCKEGRGMIRVLGGCVSGNSAACIGPLRQRLNWHRKFMLGGKAGEMSGFGRIGMWREREMHAEKRNIHHHTHTREPRSSPSPQARAERQS
jgi:hypothetical protein